MRTKQGAIKSKEQRVRFLLGQLKIRRLKVIEIVECAKLMDELKYPLTDIQNFIIETV